MEKYVIRKYEIEVSDEHTLIIPAHSEILHLGVQNDRAYIWVKVNPFNKGVKRVFKVVGTGYPIKYDPDTTLIYIGSFQFTFGLVGHVFEII